MITWLGRGFGAATRSAVWMVAALFDGQYRLRASAVGSKIVVGMNPASPFAGVFFAVALSFFSLSMLPSSGYAQLCKGNTLGCLQSGAVCSPVDIGGGSTGKCKTFGPKGERECDCVGNSPPPPSPTIQFVITTGGDDLRGDSSATATLLGANGATLQVITLKAQNDPGWGNNTTHSVSSVLNPSPSTIDHIDITLTSHNSAFETNDNWNIQHAVISVSNTNVGSKQLVDGRGNPLVRLTGKRPSVLLPLVPALDRPVCPPGTACVNVTTYHNDSLRTGWNPSEVTLTPISVTPADFQHIATVLLDDQVDAQPLYVDGVVYAATESNTIYALNFLTGAMLIRNLGIPVPMPFNCGNNGPNVGINGTPVIDPATRTLYADVYTMDTGQPSHKLYALDLATLADHPGSPVTVSGAQALKGGALFSFNATYQRQRPGLLLSNGRVYVGYGSYCDFNGDKSRGWVFGWDENSLAPVPSKELTERLPGSISGLSSIWMSGYGLAADAGGDVYFATGNASTSPTYDSTFNISETAVRLAGDLSRVVSFFTPANVNALDGGADWDFGSGGTMLLPDQPGEFPHLAVAAGKDGRMFVLNRDNMGGFNSPDIPSNVPIGGGCHCGPSYFESGVSRNVVSSGGLKVNLWSPGTTGTPPHLARSMREQST